MYKAVLTRIHSVRPHANADRLNIATVLGYQVIVGKDLKEGDRVVFFEDGGQLSEEFASQNNLYRDATKNKDPNANPGMFEDSRRVKSIRLRGERSDGFVVPITHFDYIPGLDLNLYEDGITFDNIDGHEICKKYETPKQQAARLAGGAKKVKRGETPMFRKHPDTEPFKRESWRINEPGIIYITEKLHGTSHRIGHVKDEVPKSSLSKGIKKWFLNTFKKKETEEVWTYLNGSRRVIIDANDEVKTRNSFYGTDEFRYNVVKDLTLHKGEVLYGEIVGYAETETPIMAIQSVDVFKKDQNVLEYIGANADTKITYNYGCLPGECKFYVYRIAQVNEDGYEVELSWPQVKKRCKELGIEHVPEIGFYVTDGTELSTADATDVIMKVTEGEGSHPRSALDNSHIAEGVVVRFEPFSGNPNVILKSKSSFFMNLEGHLRDLPDFIDMEDAS